jgi:hypothetical protein
MLQNHLFTHSYVTKPPVHTSHVTKPLHISHVTKLRLELQSL